MPAKSIYAEMPKLQLTNPVLTVEFPISLERGSEVEVNFYDIASGMLFLMLEVLHSAFRVVQLAWRANYILDLPHL